MVATQYSYTPTALGKISDTLTSLFADLQGEEATYNRSANCNLIILVANSGKLAALEGLIDSLSMVHPSRFFVAYTEPGNALAQASISARCHGLSKSEHVCSEVVRLSAGEDNLSAIPSVIRAHMLTGMPTEIFLFDSDVSPSLLRAVAPLADSLFVDSQRFSHKLDSFAQLLPMTKSIIDFSWVGLGVWREELKLAMARCGSAGTRPHLRDIVIEYNGAAGPTPGALPLLFAGWIVNRLQAAVLERLTDGSIRLCGSDGGIIHLGFAGTAAPDGERLTRVHLDLEVAGNSFSVEMLRAKLLETTVKGREVYRATRPFEDESFEGRVRRHFLIGESLANYVGAARIALKLREILLA